jgi:hypothetical protein
MRVRIVLRDKESGLYYRSHAEWATNGYEALTFSNILEAEEFCRVRGLNDLQLIQQSGYFHRPLRYTRTASGQMKQNNSSAALAS